MSTLLEASNLYRHYSDHCAVNDVSITLNAGDILGLLGPNGAGKTTTMNLLSGNLAPSAGSVLIKGIDLQETPKLAKRNIGYLPEQPPLYKDLRVDEYLRYCGLLKGIKRKAVTAALQRAKQRTGLADTGQRLIGNLSKGYQQRVGIAQAIIHEPDLIILDEPTVGLDPIQIREIRGLIQELGQQHGIILSTHILPEVQAVCNRIHIMHRGRIAYDDASAQDGSRQALRVSFARPADPRLLKALAGIRALEKSTDRRYLISCDDSKALAPRLAALAVEQGWDLLEMTPETVGLEQIFINLTQGEQHDDIDKNEQAA